MRILTMGGKILLYKKIHDHMTHLVTADLFLSDLICTAILPADRVRCFYIH